MKVASVRFMSMTMFVVVGLGTNPGTLLHAQEAYALSDRQVGTEYEFRLQTEGGLLPLTWGVVEGTLPPGIELLPSGVLQGTPTKPQREPYEFMIEVSESSEAPERFAQPFTLLIRAAPLRMGLKPNRLRILPPEDQDDEEDKNDRKVQGKLLNIPPAGLAKKGGPSGGEAPPPEPNAERTAFPVQAAPIVSGSGSQPSHRAHGRQGNQGGANVEDKKEEKKDKEKRDLNPATFIRISEETKRGDRVTLYNPDGGPMSRQLTADEDSMILIELIPELMTGDLALNKLFISAKFSGRTESKDVVVDGYSEIGVDSANTAAQRGMAFESAANLQTMLARMSFVAEDIVTSALEQPRYIEIDFDNKYIRQRGETLKQDENKRERGETLKQDENKREWFEKLLRTKFHSYGIAAIADFFLNEENLVVVEIIGTDVLGVDSYSLRAVAENFKRDMGVVFDDDRTGDAKKAAIDNLWEVTKHVYHDFRDERLKIRKWLWEVAKGKYEPQDLEQVLEPEKALEEIMNNEDQKQLLHRALKKVEDYEETYKQNNNLSTDLTPPEKNLLLSAREDAGRALAMGLGARAIEKLKRLFTVGSISLPREDASDGERLTIRLEARGVGGASVGIPAVFTLTVKKFGWKAPLVTDSFFFIKRLGIDDEDIDPPRDMLGNPLFDAVREVNFAPAPGASLGATFFKRGNSSWDKFLRALAPGIGINVSFMNFDDPGFDLVNNAFTKTTGVNVQVAAGPVVSLFDNNLQFTYGWNLSADRKRRYFGVGFSFIKIAKQVGKYIKR